MEDNLLKLAIERGELTLNAMLNDPGLNTFTFVAGTDEIGVAVIKSVKPRVVRVFRGYGPEVAKFGSGRSEKRFPSILGIRDIIIARLNQEGDIVDSVFFKGKVEAGMDSIMYKFRMETVLITVDEWRIL